jgi:hypothetical protein
MINYVYSDIVDGLDPKQKRRVDAQLQGRIGPGGGIIVDDPDMPTYGREAPDWWEDDDDPFSDTQAVPTTMV